MSSSNKQLRITLVRSPIGYEKTQKATVRALGLGKLNSSVTKPDNAPVRGMINKISHLVVVEEVEA
ncbi:MAG: 50S ribosomal protein L30 [Chloroflexi bacterium]|jgi:large subunit ribosomal protein L30|nr:50S ribosomal protein L30 [Chloroflexota bacterium]